MGNSVQKFLEKVSSKKDVHKIIDVIDKLVKEEFEGLDIKRLVGRKDIFRVRIGKYRIIYRIIDQRVFILDISKRNDNTYRKY